MEPEFKSTLPVKAQRLCDELEAYVGSEIQCIQCTLPLPADPGQTVVTKCNHSGATIWYQKKSDLTPQILVHELLHLRRLWMEMIPLFRFIGVGITLPPEPVLEHLNRDHVPAALLQGLETDFNSILEHLIIAPQEQKEYGFELRSWFGPGELGSDKRASWDRRAHNLMEWLVCDFLLGESHPDHKRLRCLLRERDLMQEARAFSDEIRDAIERYERRLGKAKMVLVMAKYIQIPPENVELLFWDAKKHFEQHARFEDVRANGDFTLAFGKWVRSWPPGDMDGTAMPACSGVGR